MYQAVRVDERSSSNFVGVGNKAEPINELLHLIMVLPADQRRIDVFPIRASNESILCDDSGQASRILVE
jgi:hypothetical protein